MVSILKLDGEMMWISFLLLPAQMTAVAVAENKADSFRHSSVGTNSSTGLSGLLSRC